MPCTLPINFTHILHRGRAERKGTAIQQQRASCLIIFPQTTAKRAAVTPPQQFAVLIHHTETEQSILIYNEFLVHSSKHSDRPIPQSRKSNTGNNTRQNIYKENSSIAALEHNHPLVGKSRKGCEPAAETGRKQQTQSM